MTGVPAAATHRRLASALAVSAALHATLAASVHTSDRGPASAAFPTPTASAIQARLVAPRPASRGTPGPPPPEPRSYRPSELDVRPQIMTRVNPEYPEAAARRFLGGKVVIRLEIDETGKVQRARTVKAQPPGYFESSAEGAFLAARFTPGMKNGRAVKVQMMLEVSFDSAPPPTLGGRARQ